jgi:acetylglutamate kinase
MNYSYGRTEPPVVIKYGGAAMIDEDLKKSFIEDVISLAAAGITPVLVHGGGKEISATAAALGVETTFIDGERHTGPEMMRVVTMVLAGGINKELVAMLLAGGARAAGISGIDGAMLTTRRRREHLGLVGDIVEVDVTIVRLLLDVGIIPVIAPAGIGYNGEIHNVNADRAASAVAGALGGARLVYLSDVPGIMADGKVIPTLTRARAMELMESGEISGGMIPKVTSALASLESGVAEVRIVDGRSRHALLGALTTGEEGTCIINEEHGVSSFREDRTHEQAFPIA